MIFTTGKLTGLFVIDIERLTDERGFFARSWCAEEFQAHGIPEPPVQASISYNRTRGTLRGLHFQRRPGREAKLLRCVRGSVFDVVVDLRADSPTFLQHQTVILSAENCRALYVPPGIAHGFQTLEDDTEVHYQMTDAYRPDLGDGIRWDDPRLSIPWPMPPTVMSARDRSYPDFNPADFARLQNP